jgi:hypothetical protein
MKKKMKKVKGGKMSLFNKHKVSEEQLEQDYENMDSETIDLDNPDNSVPKTMVKPNNSQNKQVSEPVDDSLPASLKPFIESFNNEFGRVVEPDKQFNLLFALYVEQKRANKILMGQNVLLEELIQTIKKASE